MFLYVRSLCFVQSIMQLRKRKHLAPDMGKDARKETSMFHRFFVPLDGSPRAEKAIPVAASLARASAGTVILAHVIVPPLTEEYSANIVANETRLIQEKEHIEARAYLDEVTERYDQVLQGVHFIVEVVSDIGTVSSSLLSLAEQEHADLIVMCSRGENRFKRLIFGSVAQSTLSHSPLPVLTLHEHGTASLLENPSRPLRLLLPLDGSAFSEALVEPLCQFLTLFPTTDPHELHLLQVITLPPAFGRFRSGANVTDVLAEDERHKAEVYLQKMAQQIAALIPEKIQIVVTTEAIVHTDVAGTVLRQVHATTREAESQYDLIALATHGRSGIRRMALGSVTEHVFGSTDLPLFVVCPPASELEKKLTKQGTHEIPEMQPSQGPVGLL